ncbi:MAG: hypothetical protein HRU21_10280 [Pseudomonadales bacterium]|nr:hypothetical protein [Pseudomonadales bacterium]
MAKKKYVSDLKRNYVALHVSKDVELFWPLLTDQELVDMVNLIEAAKARIRKEARNAETN